LQRLDRPGQRSPRDGEHAIDIDQHRADGPHAPTIAEVAAPAQGTWPCRQVKVPADGWPANALIGMTGLWDHPQDSAASQIGRF
jgi:hypothetical protein